MTITEYHDPDEQSGDLGLALRALAKYEAMRNLPHNRLPERKDDVELLSACSSFRCGPNLEIAGWEIGEGPTVGLIHGWGGQGIQFVKLAYALAGAGYKAVIIDARNHGASASARLGFDRFMTDVRELQDYLGGPPFAWVGHSAGALAFMSGRRTHGISANAFVCLAAPFFPYVPINRLRSAGVSDKVVDLVRHLIALEFQSDWDSLVAGTAWNLDQSVPLMAIYDRDDTMIDAMDANRLAEVRPSASIEFTEGLGHNRLVSSPNTAGLILKFLSNCWPMPTS